MPARKPTFRFLYFTLILFQLPSFFAPFTVSEPTSLDVSSGGDDLDDIEQMIAVDEAEEEDDHVELRKRHDGSGGEFSSSAEVLSKAQKIVLELNSDSAKRVIDENEFVLVLGYAPWCSRSSELMPQFAEAATSLKELGSSLLTAKVDGDRYPKAALLIGITGFPTLLLFVNGSSQVYTGGFTSDEIVVWTRKKIGMPIIRLSTITEATEFLKKHKMFVVGLFEKFEGPQYEEYVLAATSDNEVQFVEVSDFEIARILFPDIKYDDLFLGLVKDDPERYAAYEGTFETAKILGFLDYNKFPLVNILTELNYVRVFSSPIKLQVIVFAEPNDIRELLVPLQDVARKFKKEILFICVDISDENLAKPYLTLFGLEESEKPLVTAFDNKLSLKYLSRSDPTSKSLEEFCLGILQGIAPPYFKSQPVPDNANVSVLVIVGNTYDELVLHSPKNVLLVVHTPWCIQCAATMKKIEKLAKHLKEMDNLVFAGMDASTNEHPKLQVDDYPTLLFFPSSNKSSPVQLSPKSSLKELATFLANNSVGAPKDEL